MWLKLCLLLIFIIILFILARIVELLSWYEAGFLSHRLLDPMALSVMKLKALLEQRGVSFEGIVLEKHDLTELVEATGSVTEEDVQQACEVEKTGAVTNFTSGVHFYEQVEDAKDSVWLIQIVTWHDRPRLLEDVIWRSIHKKVSRFGFRAGILDCSLDIGYCRRKGWNTPQLLLAIPEDFETKANVKIHTYTGPTKESAIYNWIHERLDVNVHRINNYDTFKRHWLSIKSQRTNLEVLAVHFTNQPYVPMFFSSLSVKFPGRVKFGIVNTNSQNGKNMLESFYKDNELLNSNKIQVPSYMIITQEFITFYGKKRGETYSFSNMETFFKSVYPCLNDILIFSFLIGNILSCFEICLVCGGLMKRLKQFTWCIIKYNVIVIMLFLPLIAIFQFPYLNRVPHFGLKLIRIYALSNVGQLLRNDFISYSRHWIYLAQTFIIYLFIIGFVKHKYKREEEPDESEETFWNFTEMRTLEHLLSPYSILNIGHPYRFRSDLEMAMRPIVPENVIKQLPTWKYRPAESLPIEDCPPSNSGVTASLCDGQNETATAVKEIQGIDNDTSSTACNNIQSALDVLDKESIIQENGSSVDVKEERKLEYNFPSGFLPSSQCIICLEDYLLDVMLCGLPCGHHFHEKCIVVWLKLGKEVCPTCRCYAFKSDTPSMHIHSE